MLLCNGECVDGGLQFEDKPSERGDCGAYYTEIHHCSGNVSVRALGLGKWVFLLVPNACVGVRPLMQLDDDQCSRIQSGGLTCLVRRSDV